MRLCLRIGKINLIMATESKSLIRVNLTPASIATFLLLILLVVFLYLIRDLVLVILVSVVLASAIEPITQWFMKYRIPRVPAVVFLYLLTGLVFLSIIPLFIFYVVGDLNQLVALWQERVSSLSLGFNQESLSFFGSLSDSLSLGELTAGLKEAFFNLRQGTAPTVQLIFGGLFSFVMILIISFYLSVQERGVENFLRLIVPTKQENYIVGLWHRAQHKIGLWLQGQLVLSILVGILVYLGLVILRVDYPLPLALFAALFEVIPFFGPILSAVPAVMFGLVNGLGSGLMVVGLYVIIQQFESQLLYPLVVKKIIGVPPIMVILALIIGAKLAGFLGIVLAAPLAAVVMEIFDDLEKRKLSARAETADR